MREIKFRVFWTHPESDSQGFDFFNAGEEYGSPDPLCNISPFERFTGLRDINGKEIYEGDILNFDDREFGGENKFFVVTFGKNHYDSGCYPFIGFGLKPIGRDDFDEHWLMFENADFCILGNIHENPELLEPPRD